MSSIFLTLVKWLPPSIVEYDVSFQKCIQLKSECFNLIRQLEQVAHSVRLVQHSKVTSLNDCKLPLKDMKKIDEALIKAVNQFSRCFQDILVSNAHPLLGNKFKIYKELLQKTKLQLCYILQSFICEISCLFLYHGDEILTLSLKFSTYYNQLLAMDSKFSLPTNSNSVCTNTCPYIMLPLRKFSITRFLQLLAIHRAEFCCHKLIDCLLETYKTQDISEEDYSSDNSSVEIYMALTKHLSPPVELQNLSPKKESNVSETNSLGGFVNLEKLINDEDERLLKILNETNKIAPEMFGKEAIKKLKNGETKISAKTTERVLEYYEQILWAEVGNYLEHIVLWWAASPLAARPPRSSQHLREWIHNFVPTADVPSVVLSALTSLADGLAVHVTSTLWDQCFRKALVSAKTIGNPETGQLFCKVLQELVVLCNLCEVTPDWIVGAPLEELPLVEQIPILHRLDHSLHTTRLWALNECRKIANNWNVKAFFVITHTDIVNCFLQLNDLRVADHTVLIAKGNLTVHVEVCALMRSKLVSEVKENIAQLKEIPNECVNCLATICKVINLANLQMIFPPRNLWKIKREDIPSIAGSYVKKYLDKMLAPVLKTIDNDTICNMVLTLICESWLEHIYNEKIKFSHFGAFQLLSDFAYVSTWIEECTFITEQMKEKLLKNELLRRCEGVGKLLLRCPGEKLKMVDKEMIKKNENTDEDSQNKQQMPPEMYVPNQEQWLELRASRRKSLFNPLCC
ncbi:hypothetical protein ABEB36_008287 [Hypothenemus hampei]|uniref:Coiled-coil protein 142 C-terminal domain-containing protein n=1 Tax=Hypothenemus hampei TaxID=57062 RepID=A0ABD1ELC1_HYPHA